MIDKLTPEQEALIPVVRDEYLNYFFSLQFDEKKARELINWVYKDFLNLDEPEIIVLESPKACQNKAHELTGKNEYAYECFYLNVYDYYWVAFYDYFVRIGALNHPTFEKYCSLVKCNIFSLITYDTHALISKPPKYIKRNEAHKMHCTDGMAIEFSDGFGLYYVDGINFSERDFTKFFIEGAEAKEIIGIKNQEQKAVVIKHIGYDNLAGELELVEISSHVDAQGNKNVLYKSNLLPINLLRVLDATGGKPYYLGVPREQKDCLEAIAWTFNMSAKEYRERIES